MTHPHAAFQELQVRKAWTLARIGQLANTARAAGWLAGEAIELPPNMDDMVAEIMNVAASATPMQLLAARLELTPHEIDLLWLLVCIEIDPLLSRVAQLLASPGMHEPNQQIIEQLVSSRDPIDAGVFEHLLKLGLIEIELDPRVPAYRRTIRVADRVVDLARGSFAVDRELADLATLESAIDIRRETSALGLTVPPELAHAVDEAADALVVATGVEGSGRATVLRHAASASGHAVLLVNARALASETATLTRQLRAIARECRLHDAWPLLRNLDAVADRAPSIERELLRVHRGPVLATSTEACTWPIRRILLVIEVALPDEAARADMWRKALPGSDDAFVNACASAYAVSPALLKRTATAASALARATGTIEAAHVQTALRVQVERRLLGLAHRIETRQTWDDLVLPIDQFDLLIELAARVRHRTQVLQTWGFADKVGKGIGLSALFSGPPGTGKTMVAGLLARELGLDLYQVDLSRIVSKYIGETEKQLAQLFEAAEAGHAILLFDEADSLFAKRTEVKSSNDRYANLEVNYLLQRMESFSGISILTTNHETAIDQAFMRRLAFHIRVPMPEERERELLWRTMIPERAECDGELETGSLASQFVMSGGYIKNAVLRAAFFAADEGTAITNGHLWRAARAEYESMGKITHQSAPPL